MRASFIKLSMDRRQQITQIVADGELTISDGPRGTNRIDAS